MNTQDKNNNSENIRNYIYINQRSLNNLFMSLPNKNIFETLKYKLCVTLKIIEAGIEKEPKMITDYEKIKSVYNSFKKRGLIKEASDNFIYTTNAYYCIEKQNFVKISLKHSKIKAHYDIDKIDFYVSMDRSFTTIGNNSPLFLLPDKINDIGTMDGSSGYSIFKLLMEDYLECTDSYLKQISKKDKVDFAKDPVSFFKGLGCVISDKRFLETFYEKRAILKDSSHNIVYTFAYPLYIATVT